MEIIEKTLDQSLSISSSKFGVDQEVKSKKEQVVSYLDKNELKTFDSYYPVVLQVLKEKTREEMPDLDFATEWMQKVIEYNVEGGKKLRGMIIPVMFKRLKPGAAQEEIRNSYMLGWAAEMFQSASLIADDIMDGSHTRRGKPCWYKLKDVGMMAINDVLLIETLAYMLIKHFFEEAKYKEDITTMIHEIVNKTIYGQALDFRTGQCKSIKETFTMDLYSKIVKYKTSYYTIYLPIALGMLMAGKNEDKGLMKQVLDISLEIGHYFQVQDDFLDCFGDPQVTGKIGTDIEDNKCSWLFVKARDLCTPEQLHCLVENYGQNDPGKVAKVKGLYEGLRLRECFREYEKEAELKVRRMIQELPHDISEGIEVFNHLFKRLGKRSS